MRSEVTAEVLEKVAKRLGYEFIERTKDDKWGGLPIGGRYWQYVGSGSDGDLLLTILNKAEEMGVPADLHYYKGFWKCSFGTGDIRTCITAFEAVLLAFAQLEPPHD